MSPLWKGTDLVNNAPIFTGSSLSLGSGKTARSANNDALYANTTQNAFQNTMTYTVLASTPAKLANTTGEAKKAQGVGWMLRKTGQGPIVAATASNGAGFGNGDSVLVTGGTVNTTLRLTTNATGNLVSATVNGQAKGLFSNTTQITATAFQREKHVKNLSVTGGSGYTNTDTILVSNSTVNATATLVTNATGGFGNVDITLTNIGQFANNKANTDVVIAVLAANGAASNGTSATVVANLQPSTGGVINAIILGGRAGRVFYEVLVESSSISSNNTASSSNTILPEA